MYIPYLNLTSLTGHGEFVVKGRKAYSSVLLFLCTSGIEVVKALRRHRRSYLHELMLICYKPSTSCYHEYGASDKPHSSSQASSENANADSFNSKLASLQYNPALFAKGIHAPADSLTPHAIPSKGIILDRLPIGITTWNYLVWLTECCIAEAEISLRHTRVTFLKYMYSCVSPSWVWYRVNTWCHTGKRLRPTMLLLMASSLTAFTPTPSAFTVDIRPPAVHPVEERRQQQRIAEITELIHVASLLHDDVIDNAETRRGLKALNHVFGNKIAILAGVALFFWVGP